MGPSPGAWRGHFDRLVYITGSLVEALWKCAPFFIVFLFVIASLVGLGQGREAMAALLDPAAANISWFLFPILLGYASVLTASFLFFLLDRWNYVAGDGPRAFWRIWIPLFFTLSIALALPIAAEWSASGSTLWDGMTGLVVGFGIPALAGIAWRETRPVLTRFRIQFLPVAIGVLMVSFFAFGPLVFYGTCTIVLTLFCLMIRNDFRDGNPNFRPWPALHSTGLGFALLLGIGVLWLSRTSVAARMFLGVPALVLCGYSLWIGLAFLLTAALSRVSPVLVRVGWLVLVIVLLWTPMNYEPLRVLSAEAKPPTRLAPSVHFLEWLRSRPEVLEGNRPYPVFFVAAEGGGIRAAYWTSTLLASLEERYPGFTTHLYAISGVSGGSVGAAMYDAMVRDLPAEGSKGAIGCAPLAPGGIKGLRPCTAYLFQWDLLGPPLSALLLHDLPFGWHSVRRANDLEQSLEVAWSAAMQSRRFDEPFQDLWHDRTYQVPSLILNTTSADNGHRLVLSNIAARGELTAEPDVEELLGRPVRLSTAAFLSARFPLLSPVATFETPAGKGYRLVDGGYFNNSGMASVAHLLRAVLPAVAGSELAGRIEPYVLVLSSRPPAPDNPADPAPDPPGRIARSLAGALVGPVAVLTSTGAAHDETYLGDVERLVGRARLATDLRPIEGSTEAPLGWFFSAATRCQLDRNVNEVTNRSEGSKAIGRALGLENQPQAVWTSCSAATEP